MQSDISIHPVREGMKAAGELFKMYKMFDLPVEITELKEDLIRFRHLPPCPFGLEGTSKELCKAVETRGERMVSINLGMKLRLN